MDNGFDVVKQAAAVVDYAGEPDRVVIQWHADGDWEISVSSSDLTRLYDRLRCLLALFKDRPQLISCLTDKCHHNKIANPTCRSDWS